MAENFNGKQHNPRDPLTKREAAPSQQLELFKRYSNASDGFPAGHVVNAAANMLVNALRQTYGDRRQAEQRFDELFGQTKSLLLSHYDSVTGKRRSFFPHTQVVAPQTFHIDKDR